MSWIQGMARRARELLRPHEDDLEIDEELRDHFEREVERRIGMKAYAKVLIGIRVANEEPCRAPDRARTCRRRSDSDEAARRSSLRPAESILLR